MPTIFHEYTHYFLHTQFPGDYPAWFDEGLAEVLSTVKFRAEDALVEPEFGHLYQMQDSKWLPASTLLRVDRGAPEYTQHRLVASFYAQSWLFMHYALIQDSELGRNVFRYVGALNRPGTTIEQAIAETFGDEKRLDELLKKYSRRETFAVGKLPLGKLTEPTIEMPRALTGVDSGFAIADAAIAIGSAGPEVVALVDAVIAAAPAERKGFAYALRAQAATMTSDESGAARYMTLARENLSASDTAGHKALARLIFLRSSSIADANEQSVGMQRARSLYEAVRKFDDKDLEACWGFGLTSLTAKVETRAAIEQLVACVERAPRHAELNYAAAIAYSESGDLQRMRDHLVYAIRYSRDTQMRAEMRETLRSVDSHLRAQGRLKE